jgi:hypothetical protein
MHTLRCGGFSPLRAAVLLLVTMSTTKRTTVAKNATKAKAKKNNRGTAVSSSLRKQDIMPPFLVRELNYIDSQYVRNNAGANYLAYSFRTNDLYDPDPLILSGSVSGFKEIMQFYNLTKVIKSRVNITITNNENFGIIWGIVFSLSNLSGTFANRDDAVNALENDFSTRALLLAAKGGIDTETKSVRCDPWALLGDKNQYLGDTSYAQTISTSPNIPVWMNLIIASPSATSLTNGVTTSLTISMTGRFFARTNLRA